MPVAVLAVALDSHRVGIAAQVERVRRATADDDVAAEHGMPVMAKLSAPLPPARLRMPLKLVVPMPSLTVPALAPLTVKVDPVSVPVRVEMVAVCRPAWRCCCRLPVMPLAVPESSTREDEVGSGARAQVERVRRTAAASMFPVRVPASAIAKLSAAVPPVTLPTREAHAGDRDGVRAGHLVGLRPVGADEGGVGALPTGADARYRAGHVVAGEVVPRLGDRDCAGLAAQVERVVAAGSGDVAADGVPAPATVIGVDTGAAGEVADLA